MSDKINVYTCPLGHKTVTIDIDKGVTPMMMRCKQKVIENHDCSEMAMSAWYNCDQSLTPEYEWYKPDIKKISTAEKVHVMKGGVLLRKIIKK